MSQSTPFIGKIAISSSAGPFADAATGCAAFALYDNSGNPPDTVPHGSLVQGTCVMKTASVLESVGPTSLYGVAYTPPAWGGIIIVMTPTMPQLIFSVEPTGTITFSYALSYNPYSPSPALTIFAPAPAGAAGTWSMFQGNANYFGPRPFLGWVPAEYVTPNSYANLGLSLTVTTPGPADLVPGSLNFYKRAENNGLQSAVLDFDCVDLSGEDYSSAILKSFYFFPANRLVFAPLLFSIASTWAYANLSHTTFAGNSMTNAAFDHAVLNGTNFRGATLSGVTFNGATGTSPDFSGATLAGVTFSGAQIVTPIFDAQTVFNSSAGVADFSNASLPNTDFSNLDLRGVHFNGGNFTGAKFNGAQLQGAVFDRAILANADFSGAQLEGTQFTNLDDVSQIIFTSFSTDATNRTSFAGSKIFPGFHGNNWACLDLSNAYFNPRPTTITDLNAQSARLCGMDFSNITFTATNPNTNPINFANAILAAADFSNADLESADFGAAQAEPEAVAGSPFTTSAVFTATNLYDTNFANAILSGVDFSFALLWGSASLSQATLTDAIFSNAFLASANFTGLADAQCSGAVFTGAFLVNADFTGTTLQEGPSGGAVLFDGAFLQGAIFARATLTAVNFDGAVLASQRGSVTPNFTTLPPGTIPLPAPINYGPTQLQAAQTNNGTKCIDGSIGPCGGPTLAPPNPMPTAWLQPPSQG